MREKLVTLAEFETQKYKLDPLVSVYSSKLSDDTIQDLLREGLRMINGGSQYHPDAVLISISDYMNETVAKNFHGLGIPVIVLRENTEVIASKNSKILEQTEMRKMKRAADLGAEGFINFPPTIDEIFWQVNNVVKSHAPKVFKFGEFEISEDRPDYARNTGGDSIHFTSLQSKLLRVLAKKYGSYIYIEELMYKCIDPYTGFRIYDNYIDSSIYNDIYRLRKKIAFTDSQIKTLDHGYMLCNKSEKFI